ncbi:BrnT family toxin [Castellaniella caeni]
MNYNQPIRFEWDDTKSEVCFQSRGFDFSFAARAFFDPHRLILLDDRRSYGENRYQLMGKIERRLFVVVFTFRRGSVRIISARKANQREVKCYDNHISDH